MFFQVLWGRQNILIPWRPPKAAAAQRGFSRLQGTGATLSSGTVDYGAWVVMLSKFKMGDHAVTSVKRNVPT